MSHSVLALERSWIPRAELPPEAIQLADHLALVPIRPFPLLDDMFDEAELEYSDGRHRGAELTYAISKRYGGFGGWIEPMDCPPLDATHLARLAAHLGEAVCAVYDEAIDSPKTFFPRDELQMFDAAGQWPECELPGSYHLQVWLRADPSDNPVFRRTWAVLMVQRSGGRFFHHVRSSVLDGTLKTHYAGQGFHRRQAAEGTMGRALRQFLDGTLDPMDPNLLVAWRPPSG